MIIPHELYMYPVLMYVFYFTTKYLGWEGFTLDGVYEYVGFYPMFSMVDKIYNIITLYTYYIFSHYNTNI